MKIRYVISAKQTKDWNDNPLQRLMFYKIGEYGYPIWIDHVDGAKRFLTVEQAERYVSEEHLFSSIDNGLFDQSTVSIQKVTFYEPVVEFEKFIVV